MHQDERAACAASLTKPEQTTCLAPSCVKPYIIVRQNKEKRIGKTQTKQETPQTLCRQMSLTVGFLCVMQSARLWHQTLHSINTRQSLVPDVTHEPPTGGATQQAYGVLWAAFVMGSSECDAFDMGSNQ